MAMSEEVRLDTADGIEPNFAAPRKFVNPLVLKRSAQKRRITLNSPKQDQEGASELTNTPERLVVRLSLVVKLVKIHRELMLQHRRHRKTK